MKPTPNIAISIEHPATALAASFPFGPTSNGLPPPPKASGLLLAALVRSAWLVSVVATPLLNAVVRKTLLAFDLLLADDEDRGENDADVEEAVDVSAETVVVRRLVEDVEMVDLAFDEDKKVLVMVSEEALLVLAVLESMVVDEEQLEDALDPRSKSPVHKNCAPLP